MGGFIDGPTATVIVAVVTVVGGWIGGKLTGRTQKNVAQLETRGPEWESFTKSIREWTNEQLAARDENIAELRTEISELRDKLEVWKSRYYIAVQHIREWRLRYPESTDALPIPEELRNEF